MYDLFCLIKVLLTKTTIYELGNATLRKQKCIIDGKALFKSTLIDTDARLTASGQHSGTVHINWHLTSSLSGSVPEPNIAYQAQSLMWGEWWKVSWGCAKPEAEHQSTGQRSDQYWLSQRQTGSGGRLQRDDASWQTRAGHSFIHTHTHANTHIYL